LTDDIQSNIALKFTDCFLSMSGLDIYECEKSSNKKDCLRKMTDRAFIVYTEFYTHTINMCFFLESVAWHEQTEETIDRLSSSSARVTRQLEEAETVQEMLLEQQRKSMSVQQELLNNGLSLSEMLLASQDNLHVIMDEFKTSTHEQKKMIFEVFDRLASLQNWAIGEVSWLDTVIFYVSCIIVSYIITATPRTGEARIWVFVTVTLNAIFERIVVTFLLKDNFDHIEVLNENLNWWIWQFRKLMLSICVIWIGYAIYNYCDYSVVNNKLLIEIQKQNMKVIHCIEKLKHTNSDSTVEVSSRDKPEKDNSITLPNINLTDTKSEDTRHFPILSNLSGLSTIENESYLSPRVADIHRTAARKCKERITSTPSRSSSRSSNRSVTTNESEMTLHTEIRPSSRYSLRRIQHRETSLKSPV
jgi:hypothetical protein